jgi:hypothetical protein
LVSQAVYIARRPAEPAQPSRANASSGTQSMPRRVTQGATNLPQVSPTTCSTQAELPSNMQNPGVSQSGFVTNPGGHHHHHAFITLRPLRGPANTTRAQGGGGGSVSVRYKETPRGPANPMQAPGPNPCPALITGVSQSVSVRYKETPRGPANPMLTPGPNPCPAFENQGATNLPQVSPTTCSTQAELASNMYKA